MTLTSPMQTVTPVCAPSNAAFVTSSMLPLTAPNTNPNTIKNSHTALTKAIPPLANSIGACGRRYCQTLGQHFAKYGAQHPQKRRHRIGRLRFFRRAGEHVPESGIRAHQPGTALFDHRHLADRISSDFDTQPPSQSQRIIKRMFRQFVQNQADGRFFFGGQGIPERSLRHEIGALNVGAFVHQGFQFVMGKSEIEQFRVIVPVVGRAQRHRGELLSVPRRRGDETSARGFGETGFDTVRPFIEPEHFIFVSPDVIPRVVRIRGGFAFGFDDFPEHGVFQRIGGQTRQVVRGRHVPVRVQSVGIGEMGVLQSEFFRLAVHHQDEAFLGTAHMFRDGGGGIVAGPKHQSVQQVFQRHLFAEPQIDGRAFFSVCVFADLDHIGQTSVLDRHDRGHDFRQAGDAHRPVAVFAVQQSTRFNVDQRRRLRRHVGRMPVRVNRAGCFRNRQQKRRKQQRADRSPVLASHHGHLICRMNASKLSLCYVHVYAMLSKL